MIGTNNNNWVVDETMKKWKSKAAECAEKRKKYENGKKVIRTNHPTSPRCIILKYV